MELSGDEAAKFARYCALISEVGAHTNLTAIMEPQELVRKLFLGTLTLVPMLRAAGFRRSDAVRVIDIGSGAGIPGIPLAIIHPGWHVTLLESVGKKARFLDRVGAELGLENVNVTATRAEELGRTPEARDTYDIVTARAVAPLPTLLELCAPFARSGGVLVFPKGNSVAAEVRAAEPAARALSLDDAIVEKAASSGQGSDFGTVVHYRKLRPTPQAYPRRVGLPKSRPIGFGNT